MKTLFLWVMCAGVALQLQAQDRYWQQYLRFNIDVTLNEEEKSLTGNEKLVYINHSPETLTFIWFHLYPNAYRDENTALYQQIRDEPEHKDNVYNRKYGFGFINGLSFAVNGKPAFTEPHPNRAYTDVVKLLLPAPLKPGDSVTISTPFNVKLPTYFSRSGYQDQEFMICQWYPKPAVFDKDGWHEMPYLDMGEFYSEFASYTVNITVPSKYVVSATGVLQNADEQRSYKEIGSYNFLHPRKPHKYETPVGSLTKTLTYMADSVPDFAWFADPTFYIQYDTMFLSSGKVIDVFTFYHDRSDAWRQSVDFVKSAVRFYGATIGEYAYPVVQAVEGPKNASSGGMEYPMVTLVTVPKAEASELDAVITHEVGHNWFMAMLGSNERDYPWLDEGLNTYYEMRYEVEKYHSISMLGPGMPREAKLLPPDTLRKFILDRLLEAPIPAKLSTTSSAYESSEEYGITVYIKGAAWMYLLERAVGKEEVDKGMQNYFRLWRLKHPKPADLQAALEQSIGGKLNQFFSLLDKVGRLDDPQKQ